MLVQSSPNLVRIIFCSFSSISKRLLHRSSDDDTLCNSQRFFRFFIIVFQFNGVQRFQSTLVIAEHNDQALSPVTQNTVTAAKKIGGDVTVLVAGANSGPAADQASKIQGVSKVISASNAVFKGQTAESVTELVLALQNQHKFTHILAGATAFGKNVTPRIAAKLDVSPISEIVDVKSNDTFVRTIYAGKQLSMM